MKKKVCMILFFLLTLTSFAVSSSTANKEDEIVKWVEPGDQIAEFSPLLGTSYTTNRTVAEIRYLAYDGYNAILAVTVKASFQIGLISVKDLPIMGLTVNLKLGPGYKVIVGDPRMTSVPIKIEFLSIEEEDRGSIEVMVSR